MSNTLILENCELWFARLDPKKPNAAFNKANPTWELQIRTTDKAVKKQWETASLPVKAVVPDDDSPTFWRVNLRKKSIKSDDTPAQPVEVVDADLNEVDPTSIGNGSIGNIKLFQYEYPSRDGKPAGLASILLGVQLTKHIIYIAKQKEGSGFTAGGHTEVIAPPPEEDAADADSKF